MDPNAQTTTAPIENQTPPVQQPTEAPPQENKPRFTKKRILIALGAIIIVILLLGSITGAYWYANSNNIPAEEKATNQTTTTPDIKKSLDKPLNISKNIDDWKTFENVDFFYTVKYPENFLLYCEDEYLIDCYIFPPKDKNSNLSIEEQFYEEDEDGGFSPTSDSISFTALRDGNDLPDNSKQSKIGEKIYDFGDGDIDDVSYYMRLDDTLVNNISSSTFKSHVEIENEIVNDKYIRYRDGYRQFVIGTTLGGIITEDLFDDVVSTFKFYENDYDYINCDINSECLPKELNSDNSTYCTKDYIRNEEIECSKLEFSASRQ